MVKLGTHVIAGILVLGAATIAAPAHAAPTRLLNSFQVPLYPRVVPSGPTITIQTPGPSSNSFYVNGTGFAGGQQVDIYTYSATYRLQSIWYVPTGTGSAWCAITACGIVPSGTFHADVATDPCQQTVNEIAYDVTSGRWSNWVQGHISCIGAS